MLQLLTDDIRFLCVPLKVRYTQLVQQKKWKPGGRSGRGVGGVGGSGGGALGRLRRGGSSRSGYAFAHQEGFGELITSGKNMRLSSLALATFASRHSASWIDTLRKKKHNTHSTPPTGDSSPAPPLSTSSSLTGPPEAMPEEAGQTNGDPTPRSLSDAQLNVANVAGGCGLVAQVTHKLG